MFIVSVSGKRFHRDASRDARESGIPHCARCSRTDTAAKLAKPTSTAATLERLLGITIDRVRKPAGLQWAAVAMLHPPVPERPRCTRLLKVVLLQQYHDEDLRPRPGRNTKMVNGIRGRSRRSAGQSRKWRCHGKLREWDGLSRRGRCRKVEHRLQVIPLTASRCPAAADAGRC